MTKRNKQVKHYPKKKEEKKREKTVQLCSKLCYQDLPFPRFRFHQHGHVWHHHVTHLPTRKNSNNDSGQPNIIHKYS
jgi:hypothetical protein